MMPNLKVREVYSNLSQLHQAMQALTAQDVFIGVPEEKADRREPGQKQPMTNAYLSYIHEYGVPEKNIPARPHLMPGIESIQPETIAILRRAAIAALEGNPSAVQRALDSIGLLGMRAVQAMFVSNSWQVLTDRTLDARRKIGERVSKKGKVTVLYSKSRREKGRLNPLYDYGFLMKAHIYVIRKRTGSAVIKG